MQPSPGQAVGYPEARPLDIGPVGCQQAPDSYMLPGPFQPLAWLSQAKGCSGPLPELAFLPEACFMPPQMFQANSDVPHPGAFQPLPCKLPLPFPTNSLSAMTQSSLPSLGCFQPLQSQTAQQSSLAATFSRLSSQFDLPLGSSRLPGDTGAERGEHDTSRDDYLMRLLRPSAPKPAQVAEPTTGTAPSDSLACLRDGPGPPGAAAPAAEQPARSEPTSQQQQQQLEQQAANAQMAAVQPAKQQVAQQQEQQARAGALPTYPTTLAALGDAEVARVRQTMLRQQLAFTEQVYELHRLAAVQRLLMRNRGEAARADAQRRAATAATAPRPASRQRQSGPDMPPPAPRPLVAAAHSAPPAVAPAVPQGVPRPPVAQPASSALPAPQPQQQLPPHMQWSVNMGGCVGPGSFSSDGGSQGDPMSWWYHTYYGSRFSQQQPLSQGFPPADFNPAAAAAAAAAAFGNHPIATKPLASSAASVGVGRQGQGQGPKWWQDAQATFGPPGDPEVVARKAAAQRGGSGSGACEVESAPRLLQPRSGRKRKSQELEPVEESSSETTGRDAEGEASLGSAHEQRLPVRTKAVRAAGSGAAAAATGGMGAQQQLDEHEHAAHMLLSFSNPPQ